MSCEWLTRASDDARRRRQRPGQHRTNPAREDGLNDIDDVGVFLGLDVGKGEHHATAVTRAGEKAFETSACPIRSHG